MGDIYIDITVINDIDLDKQQKVHFLADTGSTRAWIPIDMANELQIKKVGYVPLELANGQIEEHPYGLCKFEFEGELVNGTVIIGPKGIEPIAGVHLLQDFRLVLDLVHHKIIRARAMKAK